MSAYLVLLFAVLSRVLPHAFHATGVNLTAVGGSLLFFGARRSRWQAVFAILALAATDYYLTVYAYGFPFKVSSYLATWAWYGAICLLGSGRKAAAAIGLALYYAIGVYPANVYQAFWHVSVPPLPDSWWYHAPRPGLSAGLRLAVALFAGGLIAWPFRRSDS